MHEPSTSDTSIANLLARVRRLGDYRQREFESCFWIEGVRNFVQAFDANWPFDTIIYSPVLLTSNLTDMLVRRLSRAGVRRVRVSPEQFRSVCTMERASGIGAIVRQQWTPLDRLDPRGGICLLAIEHIRSSSGNLGTIIRTARACGVGGIVFLGSDSDPFHPAVVRASMGGLMHLPLVRTDCAQLSRWFRAHGVQVIGLSPDAGELWDSAPIRSPVALIVGEERCGLSQTLRGLCEKTVRLPMITGSDSINVAVAAGVMMYELVRRRLHA